jgi:malate dehydrogenase
MARQNLALKSVDGTGTEHDTVTFEDTLQETGLKRKKIALIGAGHIGGALALQLGMKNLGDIVLLDVAEGLAEGKALDLNHAAPVGGFGCRFKGGTDFALLEGADLVVVTAGKARTPGMSRSDLLDVNASIVKTIANSIGRYAPDSIVIVVTNPIDVMVWLMQKTTGFPAKRIIGMAGMLDTARFRALLAMELNVDVQDVDTVVMGSHGDTMVPLLSRTTVDGVSLSNLVNRGRITEERVNAIVERTRHSGSEVVGLLKTGSAFIAPAVSIAQMVDCILNDKKMTLPCMAHLDGEYGAKGIYAGVPVVLGAGGVEKVIELPMDTSESVAFAASLETVEKLIETAKQTVS